MNIDALFAHPFFKHVEIAAALWPELTRGSAKNRLYSKLNHVSSSTGTRSLTAKDKERLKEIWEKLKREIDGEIAE